MSNLVHGSERRPLVPGTLLFDEAAALSVVVPASCRKTGRCHECVVDIRAGQDQLAPRTDAESYLTGSFRLACQATVEKAERDVEFVILRRRLRILLAPDAQGDVRTNPAVTVQDGRYVTYDGADLGEAVGAPIGVAMDIGTTSVVIELVNLETGAVLAIAAIENPERFGGSDVMTRITFETDVPGEMRKALRRALNHELKRLCGELGLDRRQLVDGYVVGNPTMRDLAFDLDIRPIGHIPYQSVTETAYRAGETATTAITRKAHELGLMLNAQARITGGPLIACHVGADAAADLVAVEAVARGGRFLLVDIGTNSEIVASDGERLVAASSPAGPAFEGGGVRYGMPGADGAIEAVRIRDGKIEVDVIGDAEPEGICGSGLVDLLAELRRAAWMNERGAFAEKKADIQLLPDSHITFSRADIGHLSIAKAATAVGQRVLLRTLGLRPEDLDHVYLAGGFANAIDTRSAFDIGLLVPVAEQKVHRVGNASIAGARALLLDMDRRAELDALVQRITHIELEREPDFFDMFTDGCLFDPIEV